MSHKSYFTTVIVADPEHRPFSIYIHARLAHRFSCCLLDLRLDGVSFLCHAISIC